MFPAFQAKLYGAGASGFAGQGWEDLGKAVAQVTHRVPNLLLVAWSWSFLLINAAGEEPASEFPPWVDFFNLENKLVGGPSGWEGDLRLIRLLRGCVLLDLSPKTLDLLQEPITLS